MKDRMNFANGHRPGALPRVSAGVQDDRHAPSGPMIWGAEPEKAQAGLGAKSGGGARRTSGTLHVGLSVRWSTSFSYGHWVQGP
jgi:hypothetical protein